MRKIQVVIGTRPGIVKMAPVYNACRENPNLEVKLLYTGQHYSKNLKDVIWEAFGLPNPNNFIDGVDACVTHAEQISKMMIGCESVFNSERPDVVLVCGDANTNFAAGVAARKLGIVLGHVESGLRSRDWSMPEEHNRVMLDHISDYLFAPTQDAADNLKSENVMGKICMTGNTVVDAMHHMVHHNRYKRPDGSMYAGDFCLVTTHRQENVDNPERLKNVLLGLKRVSAFSKLVFPMHPRTRKMIEAFNYWSLIDSPLISVVDPLPYREAIWALKHASVVLTDSGGLQEESCILGTPCVTLRDNTERPEAVAIGANIVAGVDPDEILRAFLKQQSVSDSGITWANPFGDGDAAKRIAHEIA
jgi:UDP-N-acetylglucosamine 2-epimerase (non-hydrolysing)